MNSLDKAWQSRGWLACLLWPVSLLFRLLVALRRFFYSVRHWHAAKSAEEFAVPVLIIGNISVGGTGKSPLTAALVSYFSSQGWRPGIVARGYGGSQIDTPQLVEASSDPSLVGDEPVMLAQLTGVPVCVCRYRNQAVSRLIEAGQVDIVFSDDGLQHYAMQRDIEIVVVDEHRGLGNEWLLPAGPLREPPSRLVSVDVIALHKTEATNSVSLPENVSSGTFSLAISGVQRLTHTDDSAAHSSLQNFAGQRVHAVAGIGNPDRFFRQLEAANIVVIPHPFPDHYVWSAEDLLFDDKLPVFMTSKDAVKVRLLQKQAMGLAIDAPLYEVLVEAEFGTELEAAFSAIEEHLRCRKKTN